MAEAPGDGNNIEHAEGTGRAGHMVAGGLELHIRHATDTNSAFVGTISMVVA
jgi:hypothetical protein